MRQKGLSLYTISAITMFTIMSTDVGAEFTVRASGRLSSYAPVVIEEDFDSIFRRLKADRSKVMKRQLDLLKLRDDLHRWFASGVSREGPAVMTADKIRQKDLLDLGFMPLSRSKHREGALPFPEFQTEENIRQEGGDLSQRRLATIDNVQSLFNGLLNPKQLKGLRLLVTPFPRQQFKQTKDRLDSPRTFKSVEDFTEFEQCAAYFAGEPVNAAQEGFTDLFVRRSPVDTEKYHGILQSDTLTRADARGET